MMMLVIQNRSKRRLFLLFFIMPSLAQRRLSGAYDRDVLAAVRMGHHQELIGAPELPAEFRHGLAG